MDDRGASLTGCRPSGGFSGFQQRYRSFPNALGQQGQDTHVKMIAASLSQPRAPTRLSTIRTTRDRANPLQPPVRDAMLAAVPPLRGPCAETPLPAIGSINSFQPGTNMCAWLFTILRNLFRSEYRKQRREVQATDGSYLDSLKSPPEQHSRVEFEEFRDALPRLPSVPREALLLVGASGFSYEEAAAICETAVGTIKSRVHRARRRLSELLAIDNADRFGPDHTTRAILTIPVHPSGAP